MSLHRPTRAVTEARPPQALRCDSATSAHEGFISLPNHIKHRTTFATRPLVRAAAVYLQWVGREGAGGADQTPTQWCQHLAVPLARLVLVFLWQ